MIIPNKIKIGTKTYKVIVDKHVPGEAVMGQVNYNARTIRIATHSANTFQAYTKRDIVDTFWHEVTHAILRDMGHTLESNEPFVVAFAERLTDVVLSAKI
jgi:DNA-directed RNA polymerase sigma subunit (sigma70/sigma32)